jgi:putative heme-binding domain-containing protein
MANHVSQAAVGAGPGARPRFPPFSQGSDVAWVGWAGTGAGPYMRGALQLLVCVGLAFAPLAAQSTVELTSASVIAKGNDLFAKNCATGYCHGAEGRAARGPDLRNRDWDPRKLYSSVRDGVPGTTMPPWNNILTDEDLWAVSGYIISLGTTELRGAAATITLGSAPAGPAELTGKAKHGHDLFFDLNNQKRCAICHRLGGKGTAVGPDLSAASGKSADELLNDIVDPGASIAEGYEQTVVTSKAGETIAGVKQSQTEELIRVYDSEAIPPPLRTFYRDSVRSTTTRKQSSMPANYDQFYTRNELQAIVAYLRSGNF